MKNVLTDSIRLKAEAYQYQVKRFGNYRPQKPLGKAVLANVRAANTRNCSPASTKPAALVPQSPRI